MSAEVVSIIGRPTRRPLRSGAFSLTILVAGLLTFAAAWVVRSQTVTMTGAAVLSLGMVSVPIELAMRGRLSAMHRGVLLLGVVLLVQGLHTVEHLVQLMEWYRLDRTGAQSQGIVSQLNIEWVHFGWNWIAWAGVIVAWRLGVRGRWAVPLLVWITAHSLEHSYMLFHYQQVVHELDRLGLPRFGASEVLPGVFGRDGWLSRHFGEARPWLGPLTAAPRVAIHFWWNVGELTLLTLAYFGRRVGSRDHASPSPLNNNANAVATATSSTAT